MRFPSSISQANKKFHAKSRKDRKVFSSLRALRPFASLRDGSPHLQVAEEGLLLIKRELGFLLAARAFRHAMNLERLAAVGKLPVL